MSTGITRAERPAFQAGPLAGTGRIRFAGRDYRWWVAILGMYVASRLLTTTLMLSLFVAATVGGWQFNSSRMDPTFFTFSGSWDGSYYSQVVEQGGYPTTLPLDSDGSIQQNPWAFLPLYPIVVRAIMTVTGLTFYPAGVLVAVLFGAGAALLLYRIVASRGGVTSGFWATTFFCFGPLAFVLQITYAESMFFFLMFGGLLAIMQRKYWIALPFGVAAAFTKPGALALALTLGILYLMRRVGARRGAEEFPWRERVAMLSAGAAITVAGLAWPFIAAAVTGSPGAYINTELSWWTGFIGRVAFVPMTPWFLFSWKYASFFGAILVLVVLAGYAWLLNRRTIRALGTEITAYASSYALYLFAVFLPQQSIFRMLIPLAPLTGARGLTHNRRARTIVLVSGVALQPVALMLLWFIGYP